jgi:hypothetical protein
MAAVLLLAVLALAAPGHRIDLATGAFDGHTVLGRSVARVTAALGRPDFRSRTRVGWGRPADFSYEVIFRPRNGALRAWSIVLERGPIRDPKVGDLLRPRSRGLAAAIRAHYPYEPVRAYRCAGRICSGELAQSGGPLRVTYGTTSARGKWVTIWTTR